MRALVLPAYGSPDSLTIAEIPRPEPKAGEVRVRVVASAINPADPKVATGAMKFLHGRTFPMVLGYDFSGVVDSVGAEVTTLSSGQEVFGFLHYSGKTKQGAFAEYVIVTPDMLAPKPQVITHITAAACATPGITALQALRDKGGIKQGSRVLIIGASGGVGCVAVGIAKRMGATVTGVCGTHAIDFVKRQGTDVVIDRKKQDPLKLTGPFDIIFDAASVHSFVTTSHMLAAGGTYVTLLPSLALATGMLASIFSSKKCRFVMTTQKIADFGQLATWLEAGWKIPVESTFAVRDAAQGIARIQRGEMLGRIAVQVDGGF
jgi:NADPH:quinone reductase-like Zn-dependent oxidoreductase